MAIEAKSRPIVVVQNNHVERLTAPVAEAARANGIDMRDVSSGEEVERHPALPEGGPWSPVLVFGSTYFCRRWAAADPVLSPWIHWTEKAFDAATWAERLGAGMLNQQGIATTIAKFTASDHGPMHLRPRGDMKFVGDVVPTEDANGQRSIPGIVVAPADLPALNIDPATEIWVSPLRTIDAEVRIWMIGGRAASASMYRVANAMHLSSSHPFVKEATEAAIASHDVWHPADHYVVDMALSDGAWRIIEFNPVHSAGWYDADVKAVLLAMIDAMKIRIEGTES